VSTLTVLNWKTSPDFIHFLQFEFDFNMASPAAKKQVMTLLPLAVGDNRMTGSISNAVLHEALALWNRQPLNHYFEREGNRWRYLGANFAKSPTHLQGFQSTRYGKLRHDIKVGSYCKSPVAEVMA
jgi:hypothetical protein